MEERESIGRQSSSSPAADRIVFHWRHTRIMKWTAFALGKHLMRLAMATTSSAGSAVTLTAVTLAVVKSGACDDRAVARVRGGIVGECECDAQCAV